MEYGLRVQYKVQRNIMWEEHKFRKYFDNRQHKNFCLYIARFLLAGQAIVVCQSIDMFRCGLVYWSFLVKVLWRSDRAEEMTWEIEALMRKCYSYLVSDWVNKILKTKFL